MSSLTQRITDLERATERSEHLSEQLAAKIVELEAAAGPCSKSRQLEQFKASVLQELQELRKLVQNSCSDAPNDDQTQRINALEQENSKLSYRIVHLLRTVKELEASKRI